MNRLVETAVTVGVDRFVAATERFAVEDSATQTLVDGSCCFLAAVGDVLVEAAEGSLQCVPGALTLGGGDSGTARHVCYRVRGRGRVLVQDPSTTLGEKS